MNRFRILAAIGYSALGMSLWAFFMWGSPSISSENLGWEGWNRWIEILSSVLDAGLFIALIASVVAIFLRPRPGETGKWIAVAPFFLALLIFGFLLLFFIRLGIK